MKLLIAKMTGGMFGKTQFYRGCQLLCCLVAVPMHIPTSLDEPLLELIKRDLAVQESSKPFTNLILSNHFDASGVGARHYAI